MGVRFPTSELMSSEACRHDGGARFPCGFGIFETVPSPAFRGPQPEPPLDPAPTPRGLRFLIGTTSTSTTKRCLRQLIFLPRKDAALHRPHLLAAGRRLGRIPGASDGSKRVRRPSEDSVVMLGTEIMLDRRRRRKTKRKRPLLASGSEHVSDCIEDFTKVGCARGRPLFAGAGIPGSIKTYPSSVKSPSNWARVRANFFLAGSFQDIPASLSGYLLTKYAVPLRGRSIFDQVLRQLEESWRFRTTAVPYRVARPTTRTAEYRICPSDTPNR